MPVKNRSSKYKRNKVVRYSILSVLAIIAIVFSISLINSFLSFTESFTSKPNKTLTQQSEHSEAYADKVEKETEQTEEVKRQPEKEDDAIPVNDVSSQSQTSQNAATDEETYSYTYTIDSVQNNEIYATSMQEGQVYFTQDLIKDNVELNVGDTVLVTFNNSEKDSVISVELVFAVNDYQKQTEEAQQNDKTFNELHKRTEQLEKEVNENYEEVTGNNDTSYNVKEFTITSVDGGEYTASNNTDEITFTSDQVYNGIEFTEGDNATIIYDEAGNVFEVNDGIMSEDGSYVSADFYN